MKVGDRVRHKKKGWLGIVADFMKRNTGVLVNLSDKHGIRFRWIRSEDLEVIEDES